MRRGIAGEHEHWTTLGRKARERPDQREQVLVGPLRGEAQNDTPLTKIEPRAHLALGKRKLTPYGPEAERHDVDALGANPRQLDQVAARALGIDDHAI
jgi:hypothetical protein